MMKCGHAANGTRHNGEPVCVICFGLRPGAHEIDEAPPLLAGREAKCDCGSRQASSSDLAYFEATPELATDLFYCGHNGWD